jgi:hypothetical protein
MTWSDGTHAGNEICQNMGIYTVVKNKDTSHIFSFPVLVVLIEALLFVCLCSVTVRSISMS